MSEWRWLTNLYHFSHMNQWAQFRLFLTGFYVLNSHRTSFIKVLNRWELFFLNSQKFRNQNGCVPTAVLKYKTIPTLSNFTKWSTRTVFLTNVNTVTKSSEQRQYCVIIWTNIQGQCRFRVNTVARKMEYKYM